MKNELKYFIDYYRNQYMYLFGKMLDFYGHYKFKMYRIVFQKDFIAFTCILTLSLVAEHAWLTFVFILSVSSFASGCLFTTCSTFFMCDICFNCIFFKFYFIQEINITPERCMRYIYMYEIIYI